MSPRARQAWLRPSFWLRSSVASSFASYKDRGGGDETSWQQNFISPPSFPNLIGGLGSGGAGNVDRVLLRTDKGQADGHAKILGVLLADDVIRRAQVNVEIVQLNDALVEQQRRQAVKRLRRGCVVGLKQ